MTDNNQPKGELPMTLPASDAPALDFASYLDAPFPLHLKEDMSGIIVMGRVANKVVGCRWWGASLDEAWSVQSYVWEADGAYNENARGVYPSMDLPVPPARAAQRSAGKISG